MYLSFRNHKMAVNRFDNKERQTAFQHEPRRRRRDTFLLLLLNKIQHL